MKKWFAIGMTLLVSSCAYSPIYNGKGSYKANEKQMLIHPRHTLDFFVDGLADGLIQSNTSVSAKTPIAVTSFVDLQNMETTNWLGNSVSESLIHQFQRRGFKVVDYKTTGAIQVTEQGDFALSRDWNKLPKEQEVQYVLTGTMLRQEGGVLINARLVGMQSRIVVATAQGFLPADRIGRDLDTVNSVRTEDGMIIRSTPSPMHPNNTIFRP